MILGHEGQEVYSACERYANYQRDIDRTKLLDQARMSIYVEGKLL